MQTFTWLNKNDDICTKFWQVTDNSSFFLFVFICCLDFFICVFLKSYNYEKTQYI